VTVMETLYLLSIFTTRKEHKKRLVVHGCLTDREEIKACDKRKAKNKLSWSTGKQQIKTTSVSPNPSGKHVSAETH